MSKLIERQNGTAQDEGALVRSVIELSRHAPRYGNFTFRASFKNHKLTTIEREWDATHPQGFVTAIVPNTPLPRQNVLKVSSVNVEFHQNLNSKALKDSSITIGIGNLPEGLVVAWAINEKKETTILELPLVRPVIPEHQEVTKPKTCGVARPGTEHFRCEVPDGHFNKQTLP